MEYIGMDADELLRLGAIHTAREISQQPVVWEKIREMFGREQPAIRQFLEAALTCSPKIILTGAGSSAYIGLSLKGAFQHSMQVQAEAIPTTDIVTHPTDYFNAGQPVLIISFSRSGNSPESIAALELADEICETCFHFIITCNAKGSLSRYTTVSGKYVFILPEEANDKSLAMTSSYTGMLLAGILLARIREPEACAAALKTVAGYAGKCINFHTGCIRQIARADFKRAVFLGAGPFYGTATEAHLKLEEFTDGKVICKRDSYLGLRHGPRVVIDDTTMVVYLLSVNAHAYRYEKDLVGSIGSGGAPMLEMAIGEAPLQGMAIPYPFSFSDSGQKTDELFLTLCYILPVQLLGFYKCIELGLSPDMPSVSGAITRVVEGVHIYSYHR